MLKVFLKREDFGGSEGEIKQLIKKKIEVNGYVMAYCPKHPKATKSGYVYEHILVAEKMLGRYLNDDEQVHHLNFNRLDNRKKNLLVLTKGQHTKLHNFIDRIEGLQEMMESESDDKHHVEQCLNCQEYILENGNENFCNRDCQKEYYDGNKHIPVTKEELAGMLETMNKVEIAKKFNTNRSNVQNWERRYGLI
jgi:hypothetical protein